MSIQMVSLTLVVVFFRTVCVCCFLHSFYLLGIRHNDKKKLSNNNEPIIYQFKLLLYDSSPTSSIHMHNQLSHHPWTYRPRHNQEKKNPIPKARDRSWKVYITIISVVDFVFSMLRPTLVTLRHLKCIKNLPTLKATWTIKAIPCRRRVARLRLSLTRRRRRVDCPFFS